MGNIKNHTRLKKYKKPLWNPPIKCANHVGKLGNFISFLDVYDFILLRFTKRNKGLLCRRVKLNNDSSCSISIDFSKIFCIVQPNENRNQLQLTLISLKKETQGQILWIKDCTSDYLSCSLRYVVLLS